MTIGSSNILSHTLFLLCTIYLTFHPRYVIVLKSSVSSATYWLNVGDLTPTNTVSIYWNSIFMILYDLYLHIYGMAISPTWPALFYELDAGPYASRLPSFFRSLRIQIIKPLGEGVDSTKGVCGDGREGGWDVGCLQLTVKKALMTRIM